MALNDFFFTLVCDSEFVEAGRALTAVGRHIKAHLTSREYGKGVKGVAVGLVMRELGISTQRQKRPKYTRERRLSLLGHELEDTLEFSVYPSLDSVRSAVSVRDLIEALRTALGKAADAVRSLNIPGFDTPKFLKDLDEQLELVGRSALWGRVEAGQFAASVRPTTAAAWPIQQDLSGFDETAAAPKIDTDIYEFPAAVLSFVERELPLVRLAAGRRDLTALGPLIQRVNKFIESWADKIPWQDGIFERFPDCGHLLPDLGRELAIECDRSLAATERERLHLEFQRRLERCRECLERIQRGRGKAN